MPLRILYLEDMELDVKLTVAKLHKEFGRTDILWAKCREEFIQMLLDPGLDLVLSDFKLPTMDGFQALELCRAERPLLPFILVSGTIGEERAVEVLRKGATDYVLKGNLDRLPMVIRRALAEVEEHSAHQKAEESRRALLEAASFAKVVPWKQDLPSRIWAFGDSATDVLGYCPPKFTKDPDLVESLIHTEDVHRFVTARSRTLAGQAVGFDCRMRHGNGPWIWTRWTMTGGQGVFRGVLQDVTELHDTQEQLILSQKAEMAGVMVNGLCHDFNNHLMVILANADLLQGTDLSEAQKRLVQNILRASGRSQEVVRQLLGFARKNQEPYRQLYRLGPLLEEAAGLLRHTLSREVQLHLAIPEGGSEVRVDSGQILQVLLNLGINAHDSISGAGSITLGTGNTDLAARDVEPYDLPSGKYAYIDVEDTGCGIPENLQRKMFDPFFTTKAPGKGSGLGLAMVQAIVKGHDGLIQCFSEVGKGTRFRVLLPLSSNVNGL